MKNLEDVVWAQEEPRNNGAWFFVESLIEDSLDAAGHKGMRPRYAGRAAAASPATGLMSRHQTDQSSLVSDALALSVRAEIRRTKKKACPPARNDHMSTEGQVPTLGAQGTTAENCAGTMHPADAVARDQPTP